MYSGAPVVTIQHLLGWITSGLVNQYTRREQGQHAALDLLTAYRKRVAEEAAV